MDVSNLEQAKSLIAQIRKLDAATAKGIELVAHFDFRVSLSGAKPSQIEKERMKRFVTLPGTEMEAFYQTVADVVRDSGIKISFVSLMDYGHQASYGRRMCAYVCDEKTLSGLFCPGDGDLGAEIIKTY